GFATEIAQGLKAAASITRAAAAKIKIPDQYRDRVNAWLEPAAPTAADAVAVATACNSAGFPDLTVSLLNAKATTAQVEAAIQARTTTAAAERQAADAENTRVTTIRTLCATAGHPKMADGYIAGHMPIDQVRAHLVILKAHDDQVE